LGLTPISAAAAASPTAITITVTETLGLLDGPFCDLAAGVAEGQYAFWLGSAISRDIVADLKGVVTKIVRYLRDHTDFTNAACPYIAALRKALDLAQLSPIETHGFDPASPFATWDATLVRVIQDRLVGKYSKLLDIRVEGKDPDFLLWEVADVPTTYASTALRPVCEHLCIAILGIEGVLQQAATGNWDGLIEKAVDELVGPSAPVLQVCVIADDFVQPTKRLRLLKFHGCAVRAQACPAIYRGLLVSRQGQIEDWAKEPSFAVMRQQMVSLATVQRTLMIGLSAQDTNIRDVFRDGKATMQWPWPSHPPAYVFAEETVGDEQRVILGSVYRKAYDVDPQAVVDAAHLRAFAKPLLVALVLNVLERKLRALIERAPGLSPPDQHALKAGLRTLRTRLAAVADGDRTAYIRAFVAESARALRMLRGVFDGAGAYEPLGTQIVSQIVADPNNATSGLPGFAAALGVLGLGEADGDWLVGRADPAAAGTGTVTVTPTGGSTQRFFLVANQEAALKLHVEGTVGDREPDAVVVYSTTPETRSRRSPRRLWRTGAHATRRLGVGALMQEAADLAEFRRRFREEAIL
jgi:hypothetical protein